MRGLVSPRVQALRQIDGWPVSFAAAGVVDADGRVETYGDATRACPARLRLEAGRRARDARRRGGRRRRPRRAGGAAGLDGPPSPRPRVGAPVRGRRSRSRRRDDAGSTRTRASASLAATSRRGRRCRSPTTCARPSACRSGSASIRSGDPGSGMQASLDDVLAVARELLAADGSSRRETRRRDDVACSSPGLSGVLPDYGRFEPLDWGLGVQLEHEPADVDGRRARRRARSATSAARARSSGSIRSARRMRGADEPRVRRLGEGGVAALRRRLGLAGSRGASAWAARRGSSERARQSSSANSGRTSSSNVVSSQLATTHGVIAVTVAVRGTSIVERDLAEELAGPQDPALAEPDCGHARDAREEDEEAVARLALADEHGSRRQPRPAPCGRRACRASRPGRRRRARCARAR